MKSLSLSVFQSSFQADSVKATTLAVLPELTKVFDIAYNDVVELWSIHNDAYVIELCRMQELYALVGLYNCNNIIGLARSVISGYAVSLASGKTDIIL
jgi:hypothetical protein